MTLIPKGTLPEFDFFTPSVHLMNMQFFERILNYLVKNFTFWFVLVVLETVDNIFVLKSYRTSTRDHWSGVDRGQNCAGAGYFLKLICRGRD